MPAAKSEDHAAELDVLTQARTWLREGRKVALATVVDTWGSAPVAVGGQMAVAADGRFQGSVSGGCVEGDVIAEAGDAIESGKVRTLAFGVADETAWRAGLPCGGQIKVFVEPLDRDTSLPLLDRMLTAREERTGLVLSTRLEDGAREIFDAAQAKSEPAVAERLRAGRSALKEMSDGERFLQVVVPPARVIIIGATHIAQILTELVRLAGYQVVVVDPRTAFASPERFAGTELITEWPQDALPKLGLDPYTAVVALAHVGHIDDEALKLALRSDCFYIGALGSKRNHAKRTERLLAAGFTAADIGRIAAPIGIDIGAESPPEIALSVMAQIVLALRGTKAARKAA